MTEITIEPQELNLFLPLEQVEIGNYFLFGNELFLAVEGEVTSPDKLQYIRLINGFVESLGPKVRVFPLKNVHITYA